MPEEQTLRTVLGMGPDESIDVRTAEQLAPLATRQIAR
jgi:electron transfer flavoprotein alpha/beta subunit